LRLSDRAIRFGVKPLVFVASLAPAALLVWDAYAGNLSAHTPVPFVMSASGFALRLPA